MCEREGEGSGGGGQSERVKRERERKKAVRCRDEKGEEMPHDALSRHHFSDPR